MYGHRHLGAYFNMKCETSAKISLCRVPAIEFDTLARETTEC